MNVKSSLYRESDETEIREIFTYAFPGTKIWGIRPLKGGLFNTTYGVDYGEDGRQAVLRLGPVNRHLLMGFEQNLMSAESWTYKKMKGQGIPCPEIFFCDVSKKRFRRDIMITEFLPGTAANKAGFLEDEGERRMLHGEVGRYMAALHKVTGTQFGFVSRILCGQGSQRWSQALIRETEDIQSRLLAINAVTQDEADQVRGVFESYSGLLDEIKVPHLLHGDLWEGNLLAEKKEGRCSITAVLDADRSVFGDIDFELASPWMTTQAFLRGYGLDLRELENHKRSMRRKLYRLFFALVETYVGAGEYNNEEQYRENRERVRILTEELTEVQDESKRSTFYTGKNQEISG